MEELKTLDGKISAEEILEWLEKIKKLDQENKDNK